jgi:hypothetical protein
MSNRHSGASGGIGFAVAFFFEATFFFEVTFDMGLSSFEMPGARSVAGVRRREAGLGARAMRRRRIAVNR